MNQIRAPYPWNKTISDEQLKAITKTPLVRINKTDPILITESAGTSHRTGEKSRLRREI